MLEKTDLLGTLKILEKSVFRGKFFGHFLTHELFIFFEISTKLFYFFLKDKRSNKIETIQYYKKCLF
jgi:hypothetical protein